MTRNKFLIALITLLAVALCSCKDKKKDEEVINYSSSTTDALVTKFSLQSNNHVQARLDSIHFTIDPVRGEIYNVDSLPVGTDVSSLLTTVTFSTAVKEAKYYLTYSKGGVVKRDTITYRSTSTDSLNFTGAARLDVTSRDGTVTRSYNVHVNVHKSQPDTLSWPQQWRRDLPGAGDDNIAFRAVKWNNIAVSMLHSNAGYKISFAQTPAGPWNTSEFEGDFTPDVNSLTATGDELYMLDTEGHLYTSTNASSWTDTGEKWLRIIGAYGDRVLGITADEDPSLDEYPQRAEFVPRAVPADFPMSGLSQLVTADNPWTVAPQAVMVGGVTADGTLCNKTWGYDGNTWAVISSNQDNLPALRDAIVVPYFTYKVNLINYKTTRQDTWLVMGGFKADGSANRTTYISTNQGITWQKASSVMQWPEYIPSMGGAQAIIDKRKFTSNGAPRRVSQAITEWDVPYIYLYGGYTSSGVLLNNVWCGVINRMTYNPTY